MTTMATKSSGVGEKLKTTLGSLCCESAIVTLTLVSVLAISGEILIDYGILTVPANTNGQTTTPSTASNNTTTESSASTNDQQSSSNNSGKVDEDRKTMEIVQKVFHYISLSIAIAFFIEMVLKFAVFRARFFLKHWQIVDMLVVLATIMVEIAFEIEHRMPELEACTFVVIFRLIRLPHTCSIKARKVQRDLEQDIDLWKAGKCKVEGKCANLEAKSNKQKEKIDRLERELLTLKKEMKEFQRHGRAPSNPVIANGTVPGDIAAAISFAGSNESLDSAHRVTSGDQSQSTTHARHYVSGDSEDDDVDTVASSGTSFRRSKRQDSKDTETDTMDEEEENGGIPSSDRRYFRSGSESSLSCQCALDHEVHVQIEGQNEENEKVKDGQFRPQEMGEGGKDEAPSTPVELRKEWRKEEKRSLVTASEPAADQSVYYDNSGYNPELEEEESHNQRGVLVYDDGTKTYRSAEGIPMTDL